MDSDYDYMDVENSPLPKSKKAAKKPSKKKNVLQDNTDDNVLEFRTTEEKDKVKSKYQKMTMIEHIMKRPDTYIGSVESETSQRWVVETDELVHRSVTVVPGMYKIFDEILVNAADHKKRDPSMKMIKVEIHPEQGTISVWNDGTGIPVEMHEEHNCYIPELIFGHLLTGENFNDEEERIVGGRNGYGAKLANIFSTEFVLETSEPKGGKRYKQVWSDNMSVCGKPKITKSTGKSFTCITFKPDFAKFGMSGLDDDTVALLTKRVYDIAGCSEKSLKVHLNGSAVPITSFSTYVDMYIDAKKKSDAPVPKIFEKVNERWEVCVTSSDEGQQQVSFVNSICTSMGGEHVKYIADQVAAHLVAVIKKKEKGSTIKPALVKNNLWIFVNSTIANPAFTSQSKDILTTRPKKFGDDKFLPKLSPATLKKIEKSGIVDNIIYHSKAKQDRDLARKGGSKKSKISGIPKLDDANNAGGRYSKDCTLILTEGDSAKALAIAGLSIVGRDNYGVFPLKGKLLNVRDAGHAQILKNEEIQNIMKIVGLQVSKKYTDTKDLRYGHIMIMTDQDHDGSHIKGLLINFIHHYWPSLLQIPRFLQVFVTPIVKATKGKNVLSFYTMPEYEEWVENVHNGRPTGWKIKYYKGLGTSTAKEAKEYFSELEKNRLDMDWEGDEAGDAIDMAFSKKRIEDRKTWLSNFKEGTRVDFAVEKMKYHDFVHQELILFSMADNQRSIPCYLDGLKPSQRKVLYACFKRNLKSDIKVSQLAGYVSEHSAYHHGEMSLTTTIVGMAQDFVGSNNINLLFPSGQFGTRLMGGKDAASSRYIFTRLTALARKVYHPHDDALLDYMFEEGQTIEPKYYMPVIPMVLVNGSSGIGTGWSTDIPTYNPRDLVKAIRRKLVGCEYDELVPWWRGFHGPVEKEIAPKKGFMGRYHVGGCMEYDDEEYKVHISELPVGVWTQNYKRFLEDDKNFSDGQIVEIRENHTDTTVEFTLYLSEAFYDSLKASGTMKKKFKMETTVSITNMNAFNEDGAITKFASPEQILDAFFVHRVSFYGKRKAHLESMLEKELEKLSNKARFIRMIVDGDLVISKKKKSVLLEELKDLGFKVILPDSKNKAQVGVVAEEDEQEEAEDDGQVPAKGFDYLLTMQLWNLTMEKVQDLENTRDEKQHELEVMQRKTPTDLWEEDLDDLEVALDEFDAYKQKELENELKQALVAQGKQGKKKAPARKRAPAKKKAPVKQEAEKAPTRATTTKTAVATKKEPLTHKDILSLSQRLEEKMMVSPVVKKKTTSKVVKDEDDIFDMIDEDEDDEDDFEPTPAKPKASRKRAKVKTPIQNKALSAALADDSPYKKSPLMKKVKKATAAAAKKKPAARKAKRVETSEEEISDFGETDEDEVAVATPPKRTARAPRRVAAQKQTYVVEDSEDESEDNYVESDESDYGSE